MGNPGSGYHNTRHNAGFLIIDRLAEFFKIESFEFENNYLYAVSEFKGKRIYLIKPLTYMNLSGLAVREFFDRHEIELKNMLIVYDDVNIDFGVIRLRPSGSDGGQNGIKSVIYEMITEDIPRLRIGIRNAEEYEKARISDDYSLVDFVLSPFSDAEFENLDKITLAAKDSVLCCIDEGISEAMNRYNRNYLEDPE